MVTVKGGGEHMSHEVSARSQCRRTPMHGGLPKFPFERESARSSVLSKDPDAVSTEEETAFCLGVEVARRRSTQRRPDGSVPISPSTGSSCHAGPSGWNDKVPPIRGTPFGDPGLVANWEADAFWSLAKITTLGSPINAATTPTFF
jgi:hypothetical protein